MRDKIIRRLELNVFPWLGARPIKAITAPELLAVLRQVESRGANETARLPAPRFSRPGASSN